MVKSRRNASCSGVPNVIVGIRELCVLLRPQVHQIDPQPADLHPRRLQVLRLVRVGHDDRHVVLLLPLALQVRVHPLGKLLPHHIIQRDIDIQRLPPHELVPHPAPRAPERRRQTGLVARVEQLGEQRLFLLRQRDGALKIRHRCVLTATRVYLGLRAAGLAVVVDERKSVGRGAKRRVCELAGVSQGGS